jgi:hypothetical protein
MSTRANPPGHRHREHQATARRQDLRELAKWWQLAIHKHWFNWSATKFSFVGTTTWFASAVPWSENNATAFAGTHEKHVLMIFDEASEIAPIIWETAEGAQTTAGDEDATTIWLCFGNPTMNTGRFRECWTKFRKRWITFNVDSRLAKKADKVQIKEWIEDYGEDHDFVRVRVKGQFPRVGPTQFISNELVELAQERQIDERTIPRSTPRVIGIDIALQGDDESVLVRRLGPKLYPDIWRWRIADPMQLASHIAGKLREFRPDVVFIDAIGVGSGVYSRLIQLGFDNVVPVYAGAKNDVLIEPEVYYNQRIEMWARMREWLKSADVPDDRQLYEDLIGPQYLFDINMKMRLEKKEDMKKRGVPSPDTGDALALTFAHPVPVRADLNVGDDETEPEVV